MKPKFVNDALRKNEKDAIPVDDKIFRKRTNRLDVADDIEAAEGDKNDGFF